VGVGLVEAAPVAPETATFEAFYRRERAALVALAHALCRGSEPSNAEDIVQDAFVRAYERWSTIARYERPELWLRRVAINLAMSRYRRLRVQARHNASLAAAGMVELGVSDGAAALFVALQRLPRRQAQVLALRYVDEMPTSDIAEVLSMTPGTVRTHLRRGQDGLRRDPLVIEALGSVDG